MPDWALVRWAGWEGIVRNQNTEIISVYTVNDDITEKFREVNSGTEKLREVNSVMLVN